MASAVGVAILGAILFTGLRVKTATAVAAGATSEGVQRAQLDAYHRAFLWVVIFYAVGARCGPVRARRGCGRHNGTTFVGAPFPGLGRRGREGA